MWCLGGLWSRRVIRRLARSWGNGRGGGRGVMGGWLVGGKVVVMVVREGGEER